MPRRFDEDLFNEIISIVSRGETTGYDIYKEIKDKYKDVNPRLIYYYLKVGVDRGLLSYNEKTETGNYSWGEITKKKYYKLNQS